jgi:hypothetical protein
VIPAASADFLTATRWIIMEIWKQYFGPESHRPENGAFPIFSATGSITIVTESVRKIKGIFS